MEAYSARERHCLTVMAVAGAVGLNGAFLYGAFRPDVLGEALSNPVAVAFIVEALVMVGALAWMLHRHRLATMSRTAFVALALIGGLAFALPVALLWRMPRR